MHAFVSAGKAYADEFDRSLSRLQAVLVSVDPVQLLSVLVVHGLSVGMTESGRMQKKDEASSIGQHHVELLQALSLCVPEGQFGLHPVTPAIVQEIWDLLLAVGNAFDRKRYELVANAKSEQEKAVMLLQEHLRLHTQCVRNWGYLRQVESILNSLYAPLDAYFQEILGLSATSLLRTFKCLFDAVSSRINQHVERLRSTMQARTIDGAAKQYCRLFPEVKDQPEHLAEFLKTNGVSLDLAKVFFLTHAMLFLHDAFVFSVADISQVTGLEVSDLTQALPRLSLSFGDLREKVPEHFFLDNPVWMRPLIHLKEDKYCCLLPQALFSFAFRGFDTLLASSESARTACERQRTGFLETEVERLVRWAFPGSLFKRNFIWEDDGRRYETDLIAKIDSYLLIVEVKSGGVSWPALRGAPARAEYHIKQLFIDPARQSQRLCRKLESLLANVNRRELLQSFLPFDATGIREIVRLSVTLEDMASIQTNLVGLRETGWFPPELEFAPTMSLADFQVVFESLPSVPERLHYLVRRAELERNMRYMGDEIDLLGLYLETGFNFATMEFSGNEMLLTGMSQPIDDYYEALDHGIKRRRPLPKSTTWWFDIRRQIEKRAPARWSEAAVMLLNVSYGEQQKLERMFKKVVKRVRKSKYQPSYINSVTLQPSEHRGDAFAILAFREHERPKRHEKMQSLASVLFEKPHVNRCLILGVNVDRTEYPYSILDVFDRRESGEVQRE